MLEHVERYPGVRDRAIFVGDPDDILDATFGPGLPRIRHWVEAHYEFAGYIPGFDPRTLADTIGSEPGRLYGRSPSCRPDRRARRPARRLRLDQAAEQNQADHRDDRGHQR